MVLFEEKVKEPTLKSGGMLAMGLKAQAVGVSGQDVGRQQ